MTLYWWMHWFWITIIMASVCLCNPLTSKVGPDLEEPTHIAAEITTPEIPYKDTNSRTGKAIGHSPKTPIPIIFTTPIPYQRVSIIYPLPTSSDTEDDGASFQREISQRIEYKKIIETHEDMIQTDPPITTLSSINFTEIPVTNNTTNTINNTVDTPVLKSENLTINETVKSDQNVTDEKNKLIDADKNVTQSESTEVDETVTTTERVIKNDSVNIVDGDDEVEVSTVRALSLETAVGRRAVEEPIVHVTTHVNPEGDEGLDAAGISGICFGTLVLLGLAGAISFVLYRRRYLNKPQTLNDKCSNPDSSGYIDDSTIRENSEEMYSLDNDSFLNSLEAMTIQNYWTDSVKHTKL